MRVCIGERRAACVVALREARQTETISECGLDVVARRKKKSPAQHTSPPCLDPVRCRVEALPAPHCGLCVKETPTAARGQKTTCRLTGRGRYINNQTETAAHTPPPAAMRCACRVCVWMQLLLATLSAPKISGILGRKYGTLLKKGRIEPHTTASFLNAPPAPSIHRAPPRSHSPGRRQHHEGALLRGCKPAEAWTGCREAGGQEAHLVGSLPRNLPPAAACAPATPATPLSAPRHG